MGWALLAEWRNGNICFTPGDYLASLSLSVAGDPLPDSLVPDIPNPEP